MSEALAYTLSSVVQDHRIHGASTIGDIELNGTTRAVTNVNTGNLEIQVTFSGIVIPVLYCIIVAVGIPINSVVIYITFYITKATRNAVDIYVGNLAIADLSLIATLPFWVTSHTQHGIWALGIATCKIASFLTHINMYSSIFLITAMAVDRYTVVVKAVKVRTSNIRSVKATFVVCGVIWACSIVLSLPSAIFRSQFSFNNKTYCSWKYPDNKESLWWAIHSIERNIIGFILPLLIIIRCYWVILAYVRSRSNKSTMRQPGDAKEKQVQHVTKLVTIIIAAFVFCWLPNQLSNFVQTLMHYKVIPKPPRESKLQTNFFLVHLFFTFLSFCNSVINPFIYSTSPTHRVHMKALVARLCSCCRSTERFKEYYTKMDAKGKNQEDETGGSRRRRSTQVTKIQEGYTLDSPLNQKRTSPLRRDSKCDKDRPDTNGNHSHTQSFLPAVSVTEKENHITDIPEISRDKPSVESNGDDSCKTKLLNVEQNGL